MARREELTDKQWVLIEPLIPEPPCREDGHGTEDLWVCGELDLSESFIDATFVVAKKGPESWKDQARQRHEL